MPLSPSMISKHLREQINIRGFADLGIIDETLDTPKLANLIGILEKLPGYQKVQGIVPKREEQSSKSSYSGNFGLGEFPLHTDLAHWHIPPRFILIRCIVPNPSIFTHIASFSALINDLPSNIISRAMFTQRRPINKRKFLMKFKQGNIYRWDSIFLLPTNAEGSYLFKVFNDLNSKHVMKISLSEVGRTIILDNWKMLHGRSECDALNCHRLIERAYLSELF